MGHMDYIMEDFVRFVQPCGGLWTFRLHGEVPKNLSRKAVVVLSLKLMHVMIGMTRFGICGLVEARFPKQCEDEGSQQFAQLPCGHVKSCEILSRCR